MQIHVRHAPLVQVWVEKELAYDVVQAYMAPSQQPSKALGGQGLGTREGRHTYIYK